MTLEYIPDYRLYYKKSLKFPGDTAFQNLFKILFKMDGIFCEIIIGWWGNFLGGIRFYVVNTVKVIWRLSGLNGGGRLLMPLRALFQAQSGTLVEPQTFHKL